MIKKIGVTEKQCPIQKVLQQQGIDGLAVSSLCYAMLMKNVKNELEFNCYHLRPFHFSKTVLLALFFVCMLDSQRVSGHLSPFLLLSYRRRAAISWQDVVLNISHFFLEIPGVL